MDIDVTRRLRPQKALDAAASENPPVVPVNSVRPASPPEPPSAQPKPAPSSSPANPVFPAPDEAYTIRFGATRAADQVGVATVEPDPVTGWLIVMKGCGRGRSLPLGYGIHSVGRAEDQRVCVRFGDKRISRRNHVEISYDGRGRKFYISPGRGSTLGYLNGQPLLQPAPLQAGDRITLGETEIAFAPFCGESFDWQQE